MQNNINTVSTRGQLIVNVEDVSLLKDLKKAISLLKGVKSIRTHRIKEAEADITKTAGYREAMKDVEEGRVSSYESVDDLFNELGIKI